MQLFKNIAGRILALWAMITFIITFLIIFIPSMLTWLIPDPAGQKVYIFIARVWMTVWLPLTGCTFRIRGREHFAKGTTYVVCLNHNSLMDIPLSSAFIPGSNKTIAKSSFAKVPLFGFFYRKGAVLVDRKSEKSRRESVDKMKKVLATGIHMGIYPEGTRNRTAEPLKKFHDGAFRLAVDTNTPVLPGVIFNTKKVLPLNKFFYFWPQRIELHFLPPITSTNMTIEELREKTFATMHDYYTGTTV